MKLTRHALLLYPQQMKELKAAAKMRGVSVTEVIRATLEAAGIISSSEIAAGGRREVWLRDDDVAIIAGNPERTRYDVEIVVDDFERYDFNFSSLEAARAYLEEQRFSPR